MHSATKRTYLENKVMTATPEQLQLMLYDAAIRFAQQCQRALSQQDLECALTAYERCDAILCELLRGLRPDVHRDVAENCASLYRFCQRRMDEANFHRDPTLATEAISILKHIRESWLLLMDSLAREDNAKEHSHEEALFAVEA